MDELLAHALPAAKYLPGLALIASAFVEPSRPLGRPRKARSEAARILRETCEEVRSGVAVIGEEKGQRVYLDHLVRMPHCIVAIRVEGLVGHIGNLEMDIWHQDWSTRSEPILFANPLGIAESAARIIRRALGEESSAAIYGLAVIGGPAEPDDGTWPSHVATIDNLADQLSEFDKRALENRGEGSGRAAAEAWEAISGRVRRAWRRPRGREVPGLPGTWSIAGNPWRSRTVTAAMGAALIGAAYYLSDLADHLYLEIFF